MMQTGILTEMPSGTAKYLSQDVGRRIFVSRSTYLNRPVA